MILMGGNMKTKFTFETEDLEERQEVIDMMQSWKFKSALQDIAQKLKMKYEYEKPETTWEEARNLFWEVIKEENIELF